jgi:hypothetical protein
MKIKLSCNEFEALYSILNQYLFLNNLPLKSDLILRLSIDILFKMNHRLHLKLYKNNFKTFTLSYSECLAFFCFFNPIKETIDGELDKNTIIKICSLIHKKVIV